MVDAEQVAYRLRHEARAAHQAWLDLQLRPVSELPAITLHVRYTPIRQYLKEGPDVGERFEAESQQSRVN